MTAIFLTGGSGFLGRNFIRAAVTRGDDVRALARSDRAAEVVESLGADVVRGDLADIGALEAGMGACDQVVHSAAWVNTWGDLAEAKAITVDGTRNVLDAALKTGIQSLVHVSTEAVLVDGNPIVDADETRPLPAIPIGIYPRTKGAAEHLVHDAVVAGLSASIVRPRAIWGRDDTVMGAGVIGAIYAGRFAWIDEGRPLTSTCHVENVVEGIYAALDRGAPGEAYFLTDGVDRTIREFFTSIFERVGVDVPTKNVPRWIAGMGASAAEFFWATFALKRPIPVNRTEVYLIGQEVTVVDKKARRDLGYEGKVSIEEGLRTLDVDVMLAAARDAAA